MENMNMMREKIVLDMSSDKEWEFFKSNEKLLKDDPLMLFSAEYIQGDVLLVARGSSNVDLVVDGQLHKLYDLYHVTFTFVAVAGKEAEQCSETVESKAEFMPISPEIPPGKAKDVVLGFLKSFEKCEVCN